MDHLPEEKIKEIEEIIGIEAQDAVRVSAKTGEGVVDLLETLIDRIPAPAAVSAGRWSCNFVPRAPN